MFNVEAVGDAPAVDGWNTVSAKPVSYTHLSAQDMIQGKIAGVNVNSSTGAPGDGAQIRIRGGRCV